MRDKTLGLYDTPDTDETPVRQNNSLRGFRED
eukprot:CAMPEP_0175117620 /NCGR_PEP_ID=MMETSP0086_2-20121207/19024_1 /TAXON_ID=136419 /ORGANISM="Unknown Unknown, Strain D1" /LENGTH=31 /DNA_ID= /DNA_START= /DNA_END= /DNA_ORIENTATION=